MYLHLLKRCLQESGFGEAENKCLCECQALAVGEGTTWACVQPHLSCCPAGHRPLSFPFGDPAAERAPPGTPSSAMLACLQRTQNPPGQHLACPNKSLELRKCE
ncbi:hypothetical protein P7K49_020230 [Saguinus oedipus]|uniref:Uncharacterized protein n=1 Tax=Saguinus oedipus TaxID=9490 RepID=A0ABQ9V1F7_SAGOE|nr:hypothetical protein P7K49_020230 [Saguinus oedipus]